MKQQSISTQQLPELQPPSASRPWLPVTLIALPAGLVILGNIIIAILDAAAPETPGFNGAANIYFDTNSPLHTPLIVTLYITGVAMIASLPLALAGIIMLVRRTSKRNSTHA